ncbi:unnamed protein product [Pocillopora meandrina]|uniref:Protein kinase domain-containing protein n=1 Tax=Pocillopora meandrina TaxID=46732 RepID=A0AAU9XYT3_9CNID|nr:unnamed protein product [Pocillopora meandrina]
MLQVNATESDKRDLIKELDTIKQLKPHPHVIKLLGCVTKSEMSLLLFYEYVPFGDLLGYLRKGRGLNDNYYKDPKKKPNQCYLGLKKLLKVQKIACMCFSRLTSKKPSSMSWIGQMVTLKLADFGMARDVQRQNIYERKTKGRLPVE